MNAQLILFASVLASIESRGRTTCAQENKLLWDAKAVAEKIGTKDRHAVVNRVG